MRYIICLLVILLFTWGCPSNPGKNKQGEPSQTNKDRRILTQTIVFKVAAMIQREYLKKYQNLHQDEQSKFFAYLNETALSINNITKEKARPFLKASPYSQCVRRMINSDKSSWTIKKILADYDFPDSVNREGDVLFNPYIFLPNPINIDLSMQNPDAGRLVELFYTGILMAENQLVDAIYPYLIKAMKDFPEDRVVFENIFRLHSRDYSRLYGAHSLAFYYLITGDIDNKWQLTPRHREKLREIIDYYHRNYYHTEYITVNQFTIKNKAFMWLAAREWEQAGDINKANVYLKTTFDNDVLRNVKNFHPNHQVYLYATIRTALQIPSPKMYQYVYAALDPLTKLKYTTFKELLKMQLLQLME